MESLQLQIIYPKNKRYFCFYSCFGTGKGIDLLLYRYDNGCNKTNTIQVKMSRTYYNDKEDSGYPFYLWFNRFPVQQNANWYILVGIYAKHSDEPNAGVKAQLGILSCLLSQIRKCHCLCRK